MSNTFGYCASTSVGKAGGVQQIKLHSRCDRGNVRHEIGHAIGFWHEQSRPDRDKYITILRNNIKRGEESQFMKQQDTDYQVDYQGSEYDFESIMHYPLNAFVKQSCSGCKTMEVKSEYRSQVTEENIGQRRRLTAQDIAQTKRMYHCPGGGITGFLMFQVDDGENLPCTDPPGCLNYPDPYIKFTSVDSSGNKHIDQSSVQSGEVSPEWNEWVYVSEQEWQFFRLRIWDSDSWFRWADDFMSMSVTVVPQYTSQKTITHCTDNSCSGHVTVSYSLIQLATAKLRVKVRNARDLPAYDFIWSDPDPYVVIKPMLSTGSFATSKKTKVESNTRSPTWNQWIEFGCQRVPFFNIQLWDEDNGLLFGACRRRQWSSFHRLVGIIRTKPLVLTEEENLCTIMK